MIEIEKMIPMPKPKSKLYEVLDTMKIMEVGDSFKYEHTPSNRAMMNNAAKQIKGHDGLHECEFKCKLFDAKTLIVWRTK